MGIQTIWNPTSWKELPAQQQPEWPDAAQYDAALKELSTYPPLVYVNEIKSLQSALSLAARGKAFLLQAGDCAESFHDHSAHSIQHKLKVILQMAVVLTYSTGVPVIKIGRIAGQYAKPRSSPTERYGDLELPSFRGHIVNSEEPDLKSRVPDPQRMLKAYHQSASSLNLIRSFTKGGFADLSKVHTWTQEFVASSTEGQRYEAVAFEIERALRFMAACGIDLSKEQVLQQVNFWTSHEALLLGYESALTRQDPGSGKWYDLSAHTLWIGERTRDLNGAHLEYISGISNPVGCKIGPTTTREQILGICEKLNPGRIPGRLTLISRMGADRITDVLPSLVTAVKDEGYPVLWTSDPMHGNTFSSSGSGLKTRRFDVILNELKGFFEVHKGLGTWPGGVHIELTGEDVTECLGGAEEVLEHELDV
ncbi:MAG: 3-deoxy-7-phosphoheptulonate synthase class II, partial [Acidimicrobiaceae bacterium]|nr:3-deoxy-7-phosphoheptulonate synthase class II [Acidimicrobiaceae bacterium]